MFLGEPFLARAVRGAGGFANRFAHAHLELGGSERCGGGLARFEIGFTNPLAEVLCEVGAFAKVCRARKKRLEVNIRLDAQMREYGEGLAQREITSSFEGGAKISYLRAKPIFDLAWFETRSANERGQKCRGSRGGRFKHLLLSVAAPLDGDAANRRVESRGPSKAEKGSAHRRLRLLASHSGQV